MHPFLRWLIWRIFSMQLVKKFNELKNTKKMKYNTDSLYTQKTQRGNNAIPLQVQCLLHHSSLDQKYRIQPLSSFWIFFSCANLLISHHKCFILIQNVELMTGSLSIYLIKGVTYTKLDEKIVFFLFFLWWLMEKNTSKICDHNFLKKKI